MASFMPNPARRTDTPSTLWLPFPLDEPTCAVGADLTCDVAIVGGGLTGLSTALHLKAVEPRLDVVLLDAGRIGYGASGLNSGQCAPRIGPAIERQVKSPGPDFAHAAYAYSLEAMALTTSLANRCEIDCELHDAGQWQVALRDADALTLEKRATIYRALGFDVPLLGADALRASLPDSQRIRNAIAFPARLLNPGRLCIGLKRAALERGVRIFEHTRVSRFARDTGALHVRNSMINATRIVFATDGGIGSIDGLDAFRRTVLPVAAFAAVTRPLSSDERRVIGWHQGQGLYDTRPMFNFLRPLADGRLLIGGGYRYAPGEKVDLDLHERSAPDLTGQLPLFFPSLGAMTAGSVWHGTLGCTLNEWPVVRALDAERRYWHAGGWNGHGVALAVAAGRDLAHAMAGQVAMPAVPWTSPRAPGLPLALARTVLPLYLGWRRHSSQITI
ncbi:NAD(P)/FAD-dependent oxidoreductase [Paraburkholderia saeva]|uniref:NAD(P)/FAD-dependent oxidoreductase n=1 Tax=Paraburkholderia saeva TaxID=2777537 RepID=UPI001D8BCB2A|nr:FAD-dependent oxidoreductase [Paraburkholderia saeva]CAG4903127.1 Gamma-glutamylputrescine oxidoreductase [Paraburkholderia saeva]